MTTAFLFALLFAAPSAGERTLDVPPALEAWIPWVVGDTHACPRSGNGEQRACVFPASLRLDLDDKGGRFTMQVRTFAPAAVSLPGDDKRWPFSLTDKSGRAVVVEPGPRVRLDAGSHELTGVFKWDTLPEALAVPGDIALLQLRVRGKTASAVRAEDGRVYLERQAGTDEAKNRLSVRVVRRLDDGIPLLLSTQLTLEISGDGREETLGPVLPEGFVPVSITGGLPARLNEAGLLVIQARPGTHTLVIDAQLSTNRERFAPPVATATWSDDEVWVFQAAQDLRQTRIEGIAVDPARTHLPENWKRLPAFRVGQKSPLSVFTERRGDENQGSDQLTLDRELWLDFNTQGYTFHDRIGGQLNTGWRLEASEELALGRVAVWGADQFITKREGAAQKGVEVRSRKLSVVADSRYTGSVTSIPAVAWRHDFSKVTSTLHLPPGVQLLHVSGVDSVSNTWVNNWTMLDLFLALLFAVLVWRLWGWRWGLIALVANVLLIPEAPALSWGLLVILVPEALLRVVPEGAIEKVLRLLRLCILIGLSIGTVAFAAAHIRVAMYPALERPYERSYDRPFETLQPQQAQAPSGGAMAVGDVGTRDAPMAAGNMSQSFGAKGLGGRGGDNQRRAKLSGKSKKEFDSYRLDQVSNLTSFDPKAQVQTGPGLPRWSWNVVQLYFSGPVTQEQRIQLHLMGPAMGFALALLRVFLLGLLLLCVMGLPGRRWPKKLKMKHGAWTLWCVPFLLVAAEGQAQSARNVAVAAPDTALLEQLKTRLTEPPACAPACASAGEMTLDADARSLSLELVAGVGTDMEVEVLGKSSWMPARVLVDGQAWNALRLHEGSLRVMLPKGVHSVRMSGPLPDKPSVQIELPLKPHHVRVQSKGWRVDGVHEDGLADDTLQLTREVTTAATGPDVGNSELPPLVQISRTLSLGMNWEVFTVVERRSPLGRAIVLEVPTLPGEQVTSEGTRAENGVVLVNLGPTVQQLHWRSTLPVQDMLKLVAPSDVPWSEIWELEAAPMWHVETEGIFPVHVPAGDRRVWQPWPGESVEIAIAKPDGIEGQTLTIDHVVFELRPGRRATDAELTFETRSSRGEQHILSLPDGAELSSVSIDGRTQPIRQDGARVKLPLEPRPQKFTLKWRQPAAVQTVYTTPVFDLGVPSVNTEVHVKTGSDRWVLFARGPRLGPSVLFWSLLLMLLVIALALSRVRSAPPSTLGWVLLCLGLSQVHILAGAFVAGWLLLFAWRKDRPDLGVTAFNLRQLLLIGWTLVALLVLLVAIGEGLLGEPEMQISGNGSTGSVLKWTVDRSDGPLPVATVISLPALAYRVAMLLWSLWLAFALFSWLKDGWAIFADGGFFQKSAAAVNAQDAETAAMKTKIPDAQPTGEGPPSSSAAAVANDSDTPEGPPKTDVDNSKA